MRHAHHHHIFLCQPHARIPCWCAAVETATMQPHHHRLRFCRSEAQTRARSGRQVVAPHVQHTALLRHLILRHRTVRLLHRLRTPMVALSHLLPRLHGQWRHTAFHPCVRNTEKGISALLHDALHRSRGGVHHFRFLVILLCPSSHCHHHCHYGQ